MMILPSPFCEYVQTPENSKFSLKMDLLKYENQDIEKLYH